MTLAPLLSPMNHNEESISAGPITLDIATQLHYDTHYSEEEHVRG